jgi:hypothetical protein
MTKPPTNPNDLKAADTIRKLAELLKRLPAEANKEFKEKIAKATAHRTWLPTPGPQLQAVECEADELFFGGSAGGSKTQTLIGLALTKHQRSLILRRTNREASKLNDEIATLVGSRVGFNGAENVWRLGDRTIDIGGCQFEDDKQKHKGIAHDLVCFDELADFTESQFRFIITWNRSAVPGQRVRMVAAGNPPTTPEGLWVIQYWAPWLDKNHPNPAKPGELRWFTTIGGKDVEVEGRGPHLVDGEMVFARSRTFIPATLNSNVFLDGSGYDALLAGLPEELRRAYRDGEFDAGLRDNENQVIPSAWITAAQLRWKEAGGNPGFGSNQSCMALDVAQGGADKTVLVWRSDAHYASPIVKPGSETPTGKEVAALVVANRENPYCPVVVDVGGGYGGAAIERLQANGIAPTRFNGASASNKKSNDGAKLSFHNLRAEAWWRMREALRPDQPGGSPVCLPDDPVVRADLAAPRWQLGAHGIILESKDEIRSRLGRSCDVGDAIVMCWSTGQSAIRQQVIKPANSNPFKPAPQLNYVAPGYADMSPAERHRAKTGHRRDGGSQRSGPVYTPDYSVLGPGTGGSMGGGRSGSRRR